VKRVGRAGPDHEATALHATCDRALSSHRIRQCAREVVSGRALVLSQTIGLPFGVRHKIGKHRNAKAQAAPFPRNPLSGFGLE
jgi:hypothetical protein